MGAASSRPTDARNATGGLLAQRAPRHRVIGTASDNFYFSLSSPHDHTPERSQDWARRVAPSAEQPTPPARRQPGCSLLQIR
jgi:hypothetical protein